MVNPKIAIGAHIAAELAEDALDAKGESAQGKKGGHARSKAPEPAVVAGEASPETRAAVAELEKLHVRRAVLIRRKREKRRALQRLDKSRPPVWRVASDTRTYRAELGTVEWRDETALVDQHAMLERDLDAEERLLAERVEVETEHVKDARVWSRVIRGERVFIRRFVAPQERFIRRMLGAQRSFAERSSRKLAKLRRDHPVRGRVLTGGAILPLLLVRLVVKIQELLFLGIVVGGQRKVANTAVDAPVTVRTGYQVTKTEMRSAEGRRKLRLAIFTERLLTPERRTTLLFLAGTLMLVGYLLAELVIRSSYPSAIPAKRQVDLVFFYSIATRIILPTPFEILLPGAANVIGYTPTVLVCALGGVVGSWLLFLIGAEATDGLFKMAQKRPWLKASLDWCQRVGPKHGYWILFLVMCIPFSLDSVAAAGALFRLRLSWFLWIIFLSTVIRSIIYLEVFV